MIRALGVLFVLSFLAGCNKQEVQDNLNIAYFDIEALLDKELNKLTDQGASLEKVLNADGSEERLTIAPDSAGWHEQMQLFYDAGINKPGFMDQYFEESLPPIMGVSKVIYSAKNQKNALQVMECSYESDRLTKIRLLVKETNVIYTITKEMYLYLGEEGITGFQIMGEESMRMKDDLSYSIQGTVVR